MLDLKRLAVFREVADRASFSAAAQELAYTQSVVSHHVAQLERELGVTLLERGRRPVRLTPAGERLHEHAGAILGAVRTAQADLRAVAGLEAGTLRIGAFLTACASFVPPAMSAFAASHPGVELRLDQLEPPASLPRLVAGEIDVAVVFVERGQSLEVDERLERAELFEDPYRIALAPGHRLARKRQVRVEDLRDERFCAPRAAGGGLRYRAMLEGLCERAGFAPDIAYSVDDVTVARSFVASGLTVAVVPDMTIPPPRPDVVLKSLHGAGVARTVQAMWVRGRRVPAIEPTVAALREAAGRRAARSAGAAG